MGSLAGFFIELVSLNIFSCLLDNLVYHGPCNFAQYEREGIGWWGERGKMRARREKKKQKREKPSTVGMQKV